MPSSMGKPPQLYSFGNERVQDKKPVLQSYMLFIFFVQFEPQSQPRSCPSPWVEACRRPEPLLPGAHHRPALPHPGPPPLGGPAAAGGLRRAVPPEVCPRPGGGPPGPAHISPAPVSKSEYFIQLLFINFIVCVFRFFVCTAAFHFYLPPPPGAPPCPRLAAPPPSRRAACCPRAGLRGRGPPRGAQRRRPGPRRGRRHSTGRPHHRPRPGRLFPSPPSEAAQSGWWCCALGRVPGTRGRNPGRRPAPVAAKYNASQEGVAAAWFSLAACLFPEGARSRSTRHAAERQRAVNPGTQLSLR